MKKITLGLSPRTNGFYDPHTNTNFLGSNARPKEIYISEEEKDAEKYLNLYGACINKNASLVLYEGSFPDSVIELYNKKNKIKSEKLLKNETKIEKQTSEKEEVLEKGNKEVIEVAEKVLEEFNETFEALAVEEKKETRTYNKKYNKKNK